MVLLKAEGNQTVYAQCGDTLIGFDSMASYNKFTDGRNPVLVVMSASELAKFIISPVVMKLQERSILPTIKDLTPGVIYEGNEGDRWIVGDSINSEDEMTVVLKKLKVVEELEKET